MNTPYQQLPPPPDQVSAAGAMARMLDGIGFRFHLATEGLTENEYRFRPVETSKDITELVSHMYDVLFWAYQAFQPMAVKESRMDYFPDSHRTFLNLCVDFRNHLLQLSDEQLKSTMVYLTRTDSQYPFWNLINGPLSDVLTHIGQIASWRRMAGNPVSGAISPFTGEGEAY